MSALPPNFDIDIIPSATDRHKVLWYYTRYVEDYYNEYRFGHFIMAAYAAVPALLTPDLLYKIWLNFNQYQWGKNPIAIHRIAVSDVLLSPLCREVGYELYEMDEDIRNAFLQWLDIETGDKGTWKSRLLQPAKQIAAFVEEYHQKINPGEQLWGKTYAERQTIDALNYSEPERAQESLWQKFRDAWTKGQQTEGLRLLHILALNDARLDVLYRRENKNALPALKQNAQFAEAWKSLIHENNQGFLKIIQNRPSLLDFIYDKPSADGQSLPVKVPKTVDKAVKKVKKATVYALIVAIDNYINPKYNLKGCINDAILLKKTVEDFCKTQGFPLKLTLLTDREATFKAVSQQIEHFKNARNDDYCFFYFSGHEAHDKNQKTNDGRHLILHDTKVENSETHFRQLTLENLFYDIILENNAQCVLVFDTHEVQSEQFKEDLFKGNLRKNADILRGSMVILNASRVAETTLETMIGDKQHGVFTYSMVETLQEENFKISYKSLIEKVKLKVRNRNKDDKQNPFIEAFPNNAADLQFLNDTTLPSKKSYIVSYSTNNGWILNIGHIHGVPLYTEGLAIELSNGLKANVLETNVTYCKLEELDELDKMKQYEAYASLPIEPLRLSIKLNNEEDAAIRDKLLKELTNFPDIVIQEVAQYEVQVVKNALTLTQPEQITPIFKSDNPFDELSIIDFFKKIQDVALWEHRYNWSNSIDEKPDFKIDLLDYQGQAIENSTLKLQEDNTKNTVKFALTNRNANPLWVCVLYFSNDFSIVNLTPANVLLQADHTHFVNYQGEDTIEFTVEHDEVVQGIIEFKERFKIIISTEEFDLDMFNKQGLVRDKEQVLKTRAIGRPAKELPKLWQSFSIDIKLIDTVAIAKIKETIQQLIVAEKIEQAIYATYNWMNYRIKHERNVKSPSLVMSEIMDIRDKWLKNTEGVEDIGKRILSIVSQNSNTPIEIQEKTTPQYVKTDKKALFLASNTSNAAILQMDAELGRCLEVSQSNKSVIKPKSERTTTPASLQIALLKNKPQIVHFASSSDNNPVGIYATDLEGNNIPLNIKQLGYLFTLCLRKFNIDLILFNRCATAEQAKIISEAGIPYVVVINRQLNDDQANDFIKGFYTNLSENIDYETSFNLTKTGMAAFLKDSEIAILYKNTEGLVSNANEPDPYIRYVQAAPNTINRLLYDSEHTTTLQKTLIRQEGEPPVDDEHANAVYDNVGIFLEYLQGEHNWLSLDNKGCDIPINIHYDRNYGNIFWDGQNLVIGDGDGKAFNKFAYSLPVVSAALAKGISFIAKLKFKDQSGSLSVNIADVLATAIKQKHLNQTADTADWLIGEDVYTGTFGGKAFRSLKAPDDKTLVGQPQPVHMKNLLVGETSDGFTHQNAGIPNKAFYLVAIELGTQQAAKLWFAAFKLLKVNAKFLDLYKALIKVVPQFYEKAHQKDVVKTIDMAFEKVGIIEAEKVVKKKAVKK